MLARHSLLGLFLFLTVAVGCSKNDARTERFGQQAMYAQQNAAIPANVDTKDLPMASSPKILPQTHYAAGRLFESQGQVGKAIEQYRKALLVNHNFPECHHRLGRMLSLAKQHDEALANFGKAVELKPQNPAYRNDLAFALMYHERWEEAERQLRKAIELDPRLTRAHVNLGLALSRQGRFDDALDAFRTVLPEPDAQYNLGLMYRGQQRYTEAANCFRKVLEIHPEFPAARVQLDQMSERMDPNSPATEERFAEAIPPAGGPIPTTATETNLETTTPARDGVSTTTIDIQPRTTETAKIEPVTPPADKPQETTPPNDESDMELAAEMRPADGTATMTIDAAFPNPDSRPADTDEPSTAIAVTMTGPTTIDMEPTLSDEPEAVHDRPTDPFLNQLQAEIAQQQGRKPIDGGPETSVAAIEVVVAPAAMHTETPEAIPTTDDHAVAKMTAADIDPLASGPIWLTPAQTAPAVAAPSPDVSDELVLRQFAQSTVARSEQVAERNWRDAFTDLVHMADQTRNDHLCWQDLEQRTRALLASSPAAPRPEATDWPVMTNEIKAQPSGGAAVLGSPLPKQQD